MSTTTQHPGAHAGAVESPSRGAHLGFGGVIASEWIKFRTVRSTVWTLAITLVVMVGLSLLVAFGITSAMDSSHVNPADTGLPGSVIVTLGYYFAQMTIAVLGVLTITGEYSTGMIRSTLAAVPRRLPALWAKALVLAASTAVVSAVGIGLAYLVTRPMLSSHGMAVDFGDRTTQRVLIGCVLYLVAIALLGFAIGAVLRHSAASIATVLGVTLLLPILVLVIGNWVSWVRDLGPYMPTTAGERIMSTSTAVQAGSSGAGAGSGSGPTPLAPWTGLGLLAGYVVAVLTLAAGMLRRRDA
jgi:ABC-2 type transport system permease protein